MSKAHGSESTLSLGPRMNVYSEPGSTEQPDFTDNQSPDASKPDFPGNQPPNATQPTTNMPDFPSYHTSPQIPLPNSPSCYSQTTLCEFTNTDTAGAVAALEIKNAQLKAALEKSKLEIADLESQLESVKIADQHRALAHQAMANVVNTTRKLHKDHKHAFKETVGKLEVELQEYKDKLEYANEKIATLIKSEDGHTEHTGELKKTIDKLQAVLEMNKSMSTSRANHVCLFCNEHIDRVDDRVKELTTRYNQVVARAQSLYATHSSQINQLRIAAKLKHAVGIQHQIHTLAHLHTDIKAIRADFLNGLLASG